MSIMMTGAIHYPTIYSSGISLSNLTSSEYSEKGLSFDFTMSNFSNNPYVKKYEIIESTEDLLILSCVWFRLRKTQQKPSLSLILAHDIKNIFDPELFRNITEEDRILANTIRDYFSKKIMFLTLRGIKLSKFREDLNQFIHSDGKKIQDNICGLIYRLPEFYKHDIEFDAIVNQCDKEIKNEKKHNDTVHELIHLGTLEKTKNKIYCLEYWFKNENNNLVKIVINPDNPLIDVWNETIKNKIKLSGIYYKKTQDNIDYFRLLGYKMHRTEI